MLYITVKQPPMYHQMTLDEFLFSTENKPNLISRNVSNTRTYTAERISRKLLNRTDLYSMIISLANFNSRTEDMRNRPRETLYTTFYVGKKGKGMPYIFKEIYAMQKRYIGQDTKELFRSIRNRVSDVLSNHPTNIDTELMNGVTEDCSRMLVKNGFDMTPEAFCSILKAAYRRIDAPATELKQELRCLKDIFEQEFGALYHTSAFAYIKHRSTLDAVKRHQNNQSKWFGKYDLSNFFGSTTVDFIMEMFSMIFPFSEIMALPTGRAEMQKALSLCVLDGVLPQGTPISPTITNIMMIPIDHKLSNTLRDFNRQRYVYTRYADDFLISSEYNFNPDEIGRLIANTLSEFHAPFTINTEKTRYGSSAGQNWNLGIMLNKDNQITVGYKNKRRFQAMLSAYEMDRQNGHPWSKSEVRELEGYRNYYRMVEGEVIDRIVEHKGKKFNTNIVEDIKSDLRA